mgnify:CR=1 FL=1|jgi:hypothetical protein
MARDKELIALRDKRVRSLYERYRKKRTRNGARMHTVEWILEHISRHPTEGVFISVERIKRIIYRPQP